MLKKSAVGWKKLAGLGGEKKTVEQFPKRGMFKGEIHQASSTEGDRGMVKLKKRKIGKEGEVGDGPRGQRRGLWIGSWTNPRGKKKG